ncbi:MAG: hypothetical protein RMJ53_07605 [Chitinophagales bacterium]|nr:hypothetical protein [Chitinophagales bacterium]
MKKKDLYNLIHALAPAEKKFFKEYASQRHKETNYIRLFDAIANQKEFDEEALKSKFKDEKFINNFHVAKGYLYNIILEALRNMELHGNIVIEYHNLMSEAYLLFRKQLFDLALGRLDKALEICNRMDWPVHKKEVIFLKLRILNRKDLVYAGKYFSEVCYPELLDLSKAVRQLIEIRQMHKRISFVANTNGRFRTAEDEELVQKLMDNDLINQPDLIKSFDSIFAYYNIMAYFYWMKNDLKNTFEYEEKKWLLYKNYPDRIRENVQDVSTILYNLCQISFVNFWNEKAHYYLKLLEDLPVSTKEDRLFVRNKYIRARLVQLRSLELHHQDKYQHLIHPFLKEINSVLPQLEAIERLRSLYETIIVLIRFSHFTEALEYINRFFLEPDVEDLRPVHYPFVRIFNLICHYELKNTEILMNLINTTQYSLKKRGKFFVLEKIFIKHFKRLVNTPSSEKRTIIEELYNNLCTAAEDDYEKNGMKFIEQIAWFNKYLGTSSNFFK